MYALPLIASLIIFPGINAQTHQERVKRVINGVPLNGRPTTYKAIRYYGAMGSSHGHPWYIKLFKARGSYNNILCSGSLITRIIFQTACHCVATFDFRSGSFIQPPQVNQHWEGLEVVYLGVSNRFGDESMETYSPVYTERFLVHSRCGKIRKSEIITYDFAMVQLDADWIKADCHTPYPWIEIETAPQYTSEEIMLFQQYAISRQLVCLVVGFGYYNRYETTLSDVLRVGWEIMMPERDCLKMTTSRIQNVNPKYVVPYVSWICTKNFSKHEQESGPGDSGGPMTCSNRYMGIVSGNTFSYWRKEYTKRFDIVTHYSALSYDLFASSVNHRWDLMNKFYRLPEKYNNVIKNPTKKPTKLRLPNRINYKATGGFESAAVQDYSSRLMDYSLMIFVYFIEYIYL